MPLCGNERLKVLYDYYHLGKEGGFDFDIRQARKVGADFRNDLCNGMVKYFPDHFEDEGKYCRALFIKKYPSSLSDRFLNEITSLPVHSMASIDVVPVPKGLRFPMPRGRRRRRSKRSWMTSGRMTSACSLWG